MRIYGQQHQQIVYGMNILQMIIQVNESIYEIFVINF